MENGIYDKFTGKFYRLSNRGGLGAIQELLKAHHHQSNLSCGCGQNDGVFRQLIPMRPDGTTELTVSRVDIDEHRSGCFLTLDGDEDQTENSRASSILGPIRVPVLTEANDNQTLRSSRKQYDTFARYARRIFSRGLAEAYLEKNVGLNRHANPSAAESFSEIATAVHHVRFTNDIDGFASAEACGWRLRIGLVFDTVQTGGIPDDGINAYWWGNGAYSYGSAKVCPNAMGPAVADLQIFKNHQAPPYFVLAVQNATGLLQRVWFHQVAANENYLVPTESGAESTKSVQLIGIGAALIKPVLMEDSIRVLAAFGVTLLDSAEWSYRPDFFILWLKQQNLTLQIRELRGFREGTLEDYDRLMQDKEKYFRELCVSISSYFDVFPDQDVPDWVSPTKGPHEWESPEVHYEGPSPHSFVDSLNRCFRENDLIRFTRALRFSSRKY